MFPYFKILGYSVIGGHTPYDVSMDSENNKSLSSISSLKSLIASPCANKRLNDSRLWVIYREFFDKPLSPNSKINHLFCVCFRVPVHNFKPDAEVTTLVRSDVCKKSVWGELLKQGKTSLSWDQHNQILGSIKNDNPEQLITNINAQLKNNAEFSEDYLLWMFKYAEYKGSCKVVLELMSFFRDRIINSKSSDLIKTVLTSESVRYLSQDEWEDIFLSGLHNALFLRHFFSHAESKNISSAALIDGVSIVIKEKFLGSLAELLKQKGVISQSISFWDGLFRQEIQQILGKKVYERSDLPRVYYVFDSKDPMILDAFGRISWLGVFFSSHLPRDLSLVYKKLLASYPKFIDKIPSDEFLSRLICCGSAEYKGFDCRFFEAMLSSPKRASRLSEESLIEGTSRVIIEHPESSAKIVKMKVMLLSEAFKYLPASIYGHLFAIGTRSGVFFHNVTNECLDEMLKNENGMEKLVIGLKNAFRFLPEESKWKATDILLNYVDKEYWSEFFPLAVTSSSFTHSKTDEFIDNLSQEDILRGIKRALNVLPDHSENTRYIQYLIMNYLEKENRKELFLSGCGRASFLETLCPLYFTKISDANLGRGFAYALSILSETGRKVVWDRFPLARIEDKYWVGIIDVCLRSSVISAKNDDESRKAYNEIIEKAPAEVFMPQLMTGWVNRLALKQWNEEISSLLARSKENVILDLDFLSSVNSSYKNVELRDLVNIYLGERYSSNEELEEDYDAADNANKPTLTLEEMSNNDLEKAKDRQEIYYGVSSRKIEVLQKRIKKINYRTTPVELHDIVELMLLGKFPKVEVLDLLIKLIDYNLRSSVLDVIKMCETNKNPETHERFIDGFTIYDCETLLLAAADKNDHYMINNLISRGIKGFKDYFWEFDAASYSLVPTPGIYAFRLIKAVEDNNLKRVESLLKVISKEHNGKLTGFLSASHIQEAFDMAGSAEDPSEMKLLILNSIDKSVADSLTETPQRA